MIIPNLLNWTVIAAIKIELKLNKWFQQTTNHIFLHKEPNLLLCKALPSYSTENYLSLGKIHFFFCMFAQLQDRMSDIFLSHLLLKNPEPLLSGLPGIQTQHTLQRKHTPMWTNMRNSRSIFIGKKPNTITDCVYPLRGWFNFYWGTDKIFNNHSKNEVNPPTQHVLRCQQNVCLIFKYGWHHRKKTLPIVERLTHNIIIKD